MNIPAFFACSTCRLTMTEGGGDAASWSIFALLVIILGVMSCFGAFIVFLARREKQHLDPEFSDAPQPSES